MDTNLEAVHHLAYPELILNRVKRYTTEIGEKDWALIIAQANTDVPINKVIAKEKKEVEEKERDGGWFGSSGDPRTDSWTARAVDLGTTWVFHEKGRFIWTFLMGKPNVDLYNRSVSIEHRNGFELYRLIVKAIDEIPENAKFLKGAELSNMVEQFKSKVVDLRS